MRHLFDNVLKNDLNWHFFRDEIGITLRISKINRKSVESVMDEIGLPYKFKGEYDPEIDEYEGIRYIGADLLPLFHVTSIIAVKYPPKIALDAPFERMNHALVNQSGVHNFMTEANLYVTLGLKRAELAGSGNRGTNYDAEEAAQDREEEERGN